jgi:flagellar export protein FliJ
VKTFAFRLEHVLHWREAQVRLQESRVAAASAALATIHSSIERVRAELASARVEDSADGSELSAYAAFRRRGEARIRDLEAQAVAAKNAVDAEMNRLIDANQKMKLIDNLRQRARNSWTREFERELSTFADEAFLSRYNQ